LLRPNVGRRPSAPARAGASAAFLLVACAACRGAGGLAAGATMDDTSTPSPRLRCELAVEEAAAGGPVRVRLSLANAGAADVHVLAWNTPFEAAWFGTPFAVSRDGAALPYGGAMVKRGDPEAEEYVTIPAGKAVAAVADLAAVYPLDAPGAYEVRVTGGLADVAPGDATVPRPRSAHQPRALDCPPLRLELPG
jgi:peptidyl-Lys metalloendopeptidase